MKKILLIGPLSPPVTGNSLANDVIIKGLKNNKLVEIDYINTQFSVFNAEIGKFKFNKAFFTLKNYLKLYKICVCDIVYITPGQTYLGVIKYAPFIFFAKLFRKELVVHIHGNYLKKQYAILTPFKKHIFKSILKKADKGIVLSKSLTDNLTPFLPSQNIYIVPNFVEDFLRPKQFNSNNNSLRIVFLSNLMEEKGVLDLLKALKLLRDNELDFEAKFAGNIEKKIKNRLTPYFKVKGISYLGTISGASKKELLQWGNIFILPTYYKMEGVPISILEAMANGNIILTTKHAGIPDIISKKNGFFIKTKSPEDIVAKLEFIRSHFDTINKIGSENIKYSQTFTEKRFIDNVVGVFLK